jgi:cytochrome c556
MNKHPKSLLAAAAIAAVVAAVSGSAFAQQGPKPEQLIKVRQSAFQVVAYNSGRIKTSLEGTYNKDDVQRAANTIAAVANSGLGALFAPGTEQGKGWHDTTAKAEVWSNNAHFAELGKNFATEANALAQVSAGGDPAAIKTQYGKLTKTCKACHDDFKAKE